MMNKKNNHRFGIYLPLMILLCTVACTLRTVAAFIGVDAYGYFQAAALHSVSAWILISAILIMLTYPIAYAKCDRILMRHTTPLTFIPSLLSALTLIFFVGEMGAKLHASILPLDRTVYLIALLLGIGSALFFFSVAVVESGVSDKKANFGMVLVLLLGVYAASLYLNTEIPRNAHTELAEEMTLIALSLFFLYEIRISLDKPKQNLYVTFGFIASMLCAYTVLPSLILYIASGRLLLSSLCAFLLIASLFVFTVARLYLFNLAPKDEAIAIVHSLAEEARERAHAVRELEATLSPAPNEAVGNEGPVEISVEQAEVRERADADAQATDTQAQDDYNADGELQECESTPLEDATQPALDAASANSQSSTDEASDDSGAAPDKAADLLQSAEDSELDAPSAATKRKTAIESTPADAEDGASNDENEKGEENEEDSGH